MKHCNNCSANETILSIGKNKEVGEKYPSVRCHFLNITSPKIGFTKNGKISMIDASKAYAIVSE